MATILRPSTCRLLRPAVFATNIRSPRTSAQAIISCSRWQHSACRKPSAQWEGKGSTAISRIQTASFHQSSRKSILPAEPQVVHGTVNDPVPIMDSHPTHGSYHWTFERLVSLGLVPLSIAPFAAGSLNPTLDALLCATLLIHSHIGFQAIVIDYLPSTRVPKTRALAWWGLRAATVLVGVGLYEFETNDVGLTEGIKRIWKA